MPIVHSLMHIPTTEMLVGAFFVLRAERGKQNLLRQAPARCLPTFPLHSYLDDNCPFQVPLKTCSLLPAQEHTMHETLWFLRSHDQCAQR